jgi:hypothetical protein
LASLLVIVGLGLGNDMRNAFRLVSFAISAVCLNESLQFVGIRTGMSIHHDDRAIEKQVGAVSLIVALRGVFRAIETSWRSSRTGRHGRILIIARLVTGRTVRNIIFRLRFLHLCCARPCHSLIFFIPETIADAVASLYIRKGKKIYVQNEPYYSSIYHSDVWMQLAVNSQCSIT